MPEADLCGEEDKDAEACSTGPGTEHLGIGMIGVLCSSFKENKTKQNKTSTCVVIYLVLALNIMVMYLWSRVVTVN